MTISIKARYCIENAVDAIEYGKYQKQYSSSVHIIYRYLCRSMANGKELQSKKEYYRKGSDMRTYFSTMKNVELIQDNEWFFHCAYYDAYELVKTNGRHVVFGSKRGYKDYLKGLLSKEEYECRKLRPFHCIGTARPYKGNQKFRLTEDLKHIIFQPNKKTHITMSLYDIPYNYANMLRTIYNKQEDYSLPVTYQLEENGKLSIQVDLLKLYPETTMLNNDLIPNRVFACDTNPNYYGWVVADWKQDGNFKVISYGVESFKELNGRENELKNKLGKASTGRYHYTEKKEYEIKSFSNDLIKIAKHFKCGVISIDDVSMHSSDKKKGRCFNKTVNNDWLRIKFAQTYQKNAILSGAKVVHTKTPFSSVVGNFLFRYLNMPDMCLAAFELSRRAYTTATLNLTVYDASADKHIFPDINIYRDFYDKSCKLFKIKEQNLSLKDIYYNYLKPKGTSYRVKFNKTAEQMKMTHNFKKMTMSYFGK